MATTVFNIPVAARGPGDSTFDLPKAPAQFSRFAVLLNLDPADIADPTKSLWIQIFAFDPTLNDYRHVGGMQWIGGPTKPGNPTPTAIDLTGDITPLMHDNPLRVKVSIPVALLPFGGTVQLS